MYKLLFVDDEPEVLSAISRLLRRKEPDWKCSYVHSGKHALKELAQAKAQGEQFDVVVADMRMPNMDGPTLLSEVRAAYPEIIRIVLSGAADLDANLRVIPVAHQFLTKPFDLHLLHEAVVRSCSLRDLLKSEHLKRVVGDIGTLPVRPGLYAELTEALGNPRTSMEEVGCIVESDPAMSAKVLQMVNSAFFGLSSPITNVQQAVTYLGLPKIRQLLLVLEVFHSFEEPSDPKLRYFSNAYEREHALLCAEIAKELVAKDFADHAFTAGVLHDIGRLVLATYMTREFAECFHRALIEDRPIEELELEIIGTTHAEVGAYLLALWGLPDPVVEAVAYHHNPHRVRHSEFNVVSAVHVATYLADPVPLKPLYRRDLDTEYLQSLGVEHKMQEWEEIANEISKRSEKKLEDDSTSPYR